MNLPGPETGPTDEHAGGLNGQSVMDRLAQFTQSPMFDTSSHDVGAQHHEQANTFANTRQAPMIPGSPNTEWAPPVAYMPTSPGNMPAFFTQETYAHLRDYNRPPTVPLDPAVAPEVSAQYKGVTLQGEQWQRQPNVHVRTLTDSLHIAAPYRTGDPATTPSFAYTPGNEDMTAPVGAVLPGIKNPYTLKHISDIHMIQQASLQKNIDKQLFKKGKGKGKGKGKHETDDSPDAKPVFRYIGTDTECSLCTYPLERGQMVTRVVCNHLFHENATTTC